LKKNVVFFKLLKEKKDLLRTGWKEGRKKKSKRERKKNEHKFSASLSRVLSYTRQCRSKPYPSLKLLCFVQNDLKSRTRSFQILSLYS